MNKLSGTSGQLLSVIAETINARGTARSGKSSGEKVSGESSFQDLLHTVSKLAKNALSDQDGESPAKPSALRTRVTHLADRDEPEDKTIRDNSESAGESDSRHQSAPLDRIAKLEVQNPSNPPVIVDRQLAVVAAL
ncbi:MAG: flagellar hook-length control protein FliK, partial [Isosphaeraceae bacterium]